MVVCCCLFVCCLLFVATLSDFGLLFLLKPFLKGIKKKTLFKGKNFAVRRVREG